MVFSHFRPIFWQPFFHIIIGAIILNQSCISFCYKQLLQLYNLSNASCYQRVRSRLPNSNVFLCFHSNHFLFTLSNNNNSRYFPAKSAKAKGYFRPISHVVKSQKCSGFPLVDKTIALCEASMRRVKKLDLHKHKFFKVSRPLLRN